MTLLGEGDTRVAAGFTNGSEFAALVKTDNSEVSAGDYNRVACNFVQNPNSANANQIWNDAEIDFGTATSDWGSVNKVRIYNHATNSGSPIYEANLAGTRNYQTGARLVFAANAFVITMT